MSPQCFSFPALQLGRIGNEALGERDSLRCVGILVMSVITKKDNCAWFTSGGAVVARDQRRHRPGKLRGHECHDATGSDAGGVIGVWAAHLMFQLPVWQVSLHARTGTCQWLAEFVATFGLLLTISIGGASDPVNSSMTSNEARRYRNPSFAGAQATWG